MCGKKHEKNHYRVAANNYTILVKNIISHIWRDRRRPDRHRNMNLTPASLTPDYQRGRDSWYTHRADAPLPPATANGAAAVNGDGAITR